ncbi:hypothetical protein NFI96_000121 [Prochilodus magdalenae]|nr:hypothetical protein NFI96_000121 [Prochilodus magdalenae]
MQTSSQSWAQGGGAFRNTAPLTEGCMMQDYMHTGHYNNWPLQHVSITKDCNGVVPDCHGVTQKSSRLSLATSPAFVLVEMTNPNLILFDIPSKECCSYVKPVALNGFSSYLGQILAPLHSVHAPSVFPVANKRKHLNSNLDQDITELLDSLKCNLVVPDGPKHNVPEVFYWIQVRQAGGPVNGINSLILQELAAYSRHMRPGIIVHQEEPRTHCTSGYASPDHHCPTTKPVMLNHVADGITFSMASPEPVTSVTCAQERLSTLQCAEWHRRRGQERARKRSALIAGGFTKKLLGEKLVCPEEQINRYLSYTYSDGTREQDLGRCAALICPPEPSTLFKISEPTIKDVSEVIKSARAASAPGPGGVP